MTPAKELIIIDVMKWMLLAMLVMIVLAACSNGGRSSTGANAIQTHPAIETARNVIQPAYPEAAKMKIIFVSDSVSVGYLHNAKVMRVSILYINAAHPLELACTIVHEWVHSKQVYTPVRTRWRQVAEREALMEQTTCLKIFGAPQYLINYYASADGLHTSSLSTILPYGGY